MRRNKPLSDAKKIIDLIGKAAEAKQALDVKVLDVQKSSNLVDYLIIAGAESEPQLKAIEKEIDFRLRDNKIKGFRWQGVTGSGWLVLDLGSIVVHLMGTKEREYYKLEDLWGKEAIIYHY
jgi:ribosome-associated protein